MGRASRKELFVRLPVGKSGSTTRQDAQSLRIAPNVNFTYGNDGVRIGSGNRLAGMIRRQRRIAWHC
jgi:hypothetical protein